MKNVQWQIFSSCSCILRMRTNWQLQCACPVKVIFKDDEDVWSNSLNYKSIQDRKRNSLFNQLWWDRHFALHFKVTQKLKLWNSEFSWFLVFGKEQVWNAYFEDVPASPLNDSLYVLNRFRICGRKQTIHRSPFCLFW